jgi:DNA polymerase III alpha subunit (gram-positive type)
MHYLAYDCETGGFEENKHSLLTAYFGVYSEDLVLIDDLYLQLKPEDVSKINCDPGALAVNKINLTEHIEDTDTVTYDVGKQRLVDLLTRNKIKGKRNHYTPFGHNIAFDNRFIWTQLLPEDEWKKLVHYLPVDTTNMATILKKIGFLPPNQNIKLTELVKYYEIPEVDAHNARGDIKMNIEVYKKMCASITDLKKNAIGSSTNNLLKIIEG